MIAVKVVNSGNTANSSDVIRGLQYINYLKNVQGRNIVAANSSIAGFGFSRALRDAYAGADQPGMAPILHICAAGNHGENTDLQPNYPSGFDLDNIVSVAATDWNDQYADWAAQGYPPEVLTTSNYGAMSVDLAAAGDVVSSTTLDGRYDFFVGTSFAAPQVSGAAALVFSAFPGITAAQAKHRILAGVDPIGHIGANALKPTLTNGRLNVANALAGAPQNRDSRAPAAIANLAAAAATFQSVTLNWTATGDDDATGRAAFYDVRYATSPITKSNWDFAARATRETSAKPVGAPETFTIPGLDPGTTYYFALKVRDEIGNESPLSSVTAATTPLAVAHFSDNVEDGDNGWTASGLWHRSSARANSASTAWYYGVGPTRTYDTGAANRGALTSPLIDLRNVNRPILIFKEWREVEDIPFADVASVEISTGANKWETASVRDFSTSPVPLNWQDRANFFGWDFQLNSGLRTPQWASCAVDLSAYAGKKIQIRFSFDTADELFNNFEGWYVDDVNVFSAAAPGGARLKVRAARELRVNPLRQRHSVTGTLVLTECARRNRARHLSYAAVDQRYCTTNPPPMVQGSQGRLQQFQGTTKTGRCEVAGFGFRPVRLELTAARGLNTVAFGPSTGKGAAAESASWSAIRIGRSDSAFGTPSADSTRSLDSLDAEEELAMR